MVNFRVQKKYFKGLLFPVSVCYTLGIATQEIEVNKLTEQDNEILRAIADGETRFQYLQDDGWYPTDVAGALFQIHAQLIDGNGNAVRIAPRIIRIGWVDAPAPMRKKPASHERYSVIAGDGSIQTLLWNNDKGDICRFNFGIWPTEEDATAVRDALRRLYQGGVA